MSVLSDGPGLEDGTAIADDSVATSVFHMVSGHNETSCLAMNTSKIRRMGNDNVWGPLVQCKKYIRQVETRFLPCTTTILVPWLTETLSPLSLMMKLECLVKELHLTDKNHQEQYMKKLERENAALKKKNQKLATTKDLQEHADEEYCLLHNGYSKRTCTIARGEKGLNLWDYSGTAKSVIHEVLQRYENKIFTVDAYPDDTKQAEIVHSLWADVCENVRKEFELTAALQSMVSDKKKIQQTNKNLYVMLSTGSAFSFKNQKAPGIRYSDDYDLIKPESLALVMTILENCIEEWSSSKYVPRPLDEDIQRPRYLAHLADVKKWSNSGAKAKEKVTGYLDDEEEENRAKADLDGRTGETDSEDEPDEDDEGNQMEVLDE
ncbi:uncharacterized protein EV420DRAFT_1485832 [Desarmillaria tabescens]|uniref:DUF6532 domain-containing protein n=1 Tax=Armillaria tabescens TaxID=1929756 RepID=A0AA39JI23_ARMTA|nr:uncharacterized protein EV420DRAFT_1485832 [Desarmillaria tabescens]KAK0440878.1 hypothetical protein EV420DRAFT_1485832 [Desarmillaria tabescens]